MMTKIEEVAKAIEELGSVDPANYRDRHRIALAALRALREPSEGMLAAVPWPDEHLKEIFTGMIDHAIHEAETA